MQIARIGGGSVEQYPAEMVGAKAANLAHIAALGLPVPPAFVLPIALCAAIEAGDSAALQQVTGLLAQGIEFLEQTTGKKFGDRRNPLLVSVRSGAARSMPGMLDTVLDVGCTSAVVRALIRGTGHPRFAFDCRRRFLESYGDVVLGIGAAAFAAKRKELIAAEKVAGERDFDCEALERLVKAYERVIEDEDFVLSENPMDQLEAAAHAVFRSWTSERARTYRRLQHFDDLKGTAVTVEAMVFGNSSVSSGAGVAFSRDPSTGAAVPVVDVLFDSQGEDVVSGSHNPETEEAIARSLPDVAKELREALQRLEQDFGDMQDVEFTIENGRLWILQTRAAKRTPQAALRLAIDFVHEGRITPAEALQRLDGINLATLTRQKLVIAAEPIAFGTGATGGIAVGRAAFDPDSAARLAASGAPVILVRPDTTTADVGGFAVSKGILTAVGGRTAHAALVARQLGVPCVVGCAALAVDVAGRAARLEHAHLKEGDWLSIDGETGAVYLGQGRIIAERPEAELAEVERWRHAEAERLNASAHSRAGGNP